MRKIKPAQNGNALLRRHAVHFEYLEQYVADHVGRVHGVRLLPALDLHAQHELVHDHIGHVVVDERVGLLVHFSLLSLFLVVIFVDLVFLVCCLLFTHILDHK